MQKNFQKELNETRNTLHEREKQLATLDGKLSSITKESDRLNKLLEKKKKNFLSVFQVNKVIALSMSMHIKRL